jgi:predicted HAD superfamily Cof-like phosphohydrolase
MYDKLNYEELLLLIYLTYGEYTENSVVAEKILEPVKRVSIAKNLYRKGLISDERLHEIIGGD